MRSAHLARARDAFWALVTAGTAVTGESTAAAVAHIANAESTGEEGMV